MFVPHGLFLLPMIVLECGLLVMITQIVHVLHVLPLNTKIMVIIPVHHGPIHWKIVMWEMSSHLDLLLEIVPVYKIVHFVK